MADPTEIVAKEVKAELRREVDNLRGEMYQVRNLVQDAIVKLTASFSGMRDQANEQMEVVEEVISSTQGQEVATKGKPAHKVVNIRQFVDETDQILRSFVDHIVVVSRQSMEMVHRIEDLSLQMKKIVALLREVSAISDQTNVLALNARIVAARAGEAGKSFAVVADEVRKLSKNSNHFSAEIGQVVGLAMSNIDDARRIIEVMASKDMSFAIQSKGRVDEMMDDISDIDQFTGNKLRELSHLTGAINHSVGVAVMSLQFEDMVTQLSQNMERKFAMLEEFTDHLCCGCLAKGDNGDLAARIEQARELVRQQRTLFDEADRRAVHQNSMDEGDIELF